MSGGADRFLLLIKEELKPWVADHFAADPDNDIFFGNSLGGLSRAHVLVSEPQTFKQYGLGSASLWHNRGSIFETEATYAGHTMTYQRRSCSR
jgi:ferri-bacillibactin esterase